MGNPHQPDLPDDLRMVEERLREGRAGLSPLEYDGVKRRVLTRFAARHRRPNLMRSRIAMAVTTAVLLGSAGGAVALSGLDSHPNTNGGAAQSQYKGHHGCGHQSGGGCCKQHPHAKACKSSRHSRRKVKHHHGKGSHHGRTGKHHHRQQHHKHHGKKG